MTVGGFKQEQDLIVLPVRENLYSEEITVGKWRKNKYREWGEVISVSNLPVEMGFLEPLPCAFAYAR